MKGGTLCSLILGVRSMKKILQIENIIPAALLAFVSWLGVNAVSSNEAIAALQTSQQEYSQTTKDVRSMAIAMPQLVSQQKDILSSLGKVNSEIDILQKKQDDANSRLYCVSKFPQGADRDDCIDRLIE